MTATTSFPQIHVEENATAPTPTAGTSAHKNGSLPAEISTRPGPRAAEDSSEIERLKARIEALERAHSRKHRRGRARSCSTCYSSDGSDTEIQPKNSVKIQQEQNQSEAARDPRIMYIESRWSTKKGRWVDLPGRPSPVRTAPRDVDHGIIWKVKRRRSNRPELDVKEATILNEDLKKILAEALKFYPGHWDEEMMFHSNPLPFAPLIHNWEKLQSLAEETHEDKASKLARDDLKSLLVEVRRSDECENYFASLEQLRKDKVISFKFLWTLFPPGAMVLAEPYGEEQAFIVSGCGYGLPVGFGRGLRRVVSDSDSNDEPDLHNWLWLYCWCYDFDGDEFRRVHFNITIPEYPGKKKVTALPFFPLEYDEEDAEERKKRLVDRGRKFRNYNIKDETATMFSHAGKAQQESARMRARLFDLDANEDRPFGGGIYIPVADDSKRFARQTTSVEITGRVIVDAKMCRKYGPVVFTLPFQRLKSEWRGQECPCAKCQANPYLMKTFRTAYDRSRDKKGKWLDFSEEQFVLCSPRVLGYSLDKKIWIQMLLKNMDTVSQSSDRNAFEDLVLPDDSLPENTKFLIESLVSHHITAKARKSRGQTGGLEDFVEGKGQGLVILLHGASGTGKTLTVECVSKLTGKPLLKISVADIGIDPEKVEEKLSIYFDLASAWDAILLIDEADILLETRTEDKGTLDRNAMVSVFLKILEYYGGILLLTTNRVKTIDAAVESRINLAVEFKDMQPREQQALFKKFLDKLGPNDIENRANLERLASRYFKAQDLNGRDIRNLISSALAIARSKREKLDWQHIEIVKQAKVESQKTFAEQRAIARASQ